MDMLLKAIRHYIPLSSDDETIIWSLFRVQKLQKGQHLLQAGAICKNIFFIEQGLVRYYAIIDGEEKTSYFNKEGEFVCDYASFLPQTPSTINIQALEACTVYFISHSNMHLFYERVKYGERFGRLALEDVYVNLINQVRPLYNDTPELRYQFFLSKFPDTGQRIPQYYIASYIGIKPQSLSRIRKRMSGRN
ncbi:Crp/Fnr family transcriptional regulator [Niastella koreensis]|uniref:Crp/Fnr family transcriptional regulator n=2 Tax=Niastella koreensis TaxID=354356 RepID=A0ABX3NZ28_9BACT|nr:Crp/Fnr family transcriptional regulator [Niastella koreensis]AEV99572.1 putative transcriptional regulator, Crp/Fnr family [Niastella koreensis GR20-10]OQP50162.1 Crp/Fnr family transcriptional regulator [Niastella koreensis]